MREKECPACAVDVPHDAVVCPICGYEFPQRKMHWRWVALLLLVLLIIPFIRLVSRLLNEF